MGAVGPASAKTAAIFSVKCKPYGTDTDATLQADINVSGPGDMIEIKGTCFGNFVISGKTNLTLIGAGKIPTLNGGASGSVLDVDSGSIVSVKNLTITNGTAPSGGGIELSGSTLKLSRSIVSGSKAVGGGDVLNEGGGIYVAGSTLSVTGSKVSGNSAHDFGGGIVGVDRSSLDVTNSTVSGNHADSDSGGILALGSTLSVTGSKVSGNSAQGFGGGIEAGIGSTLNLTNSSVSNNHADQGGGGIEVFEGSNANLTQATVSQNTVTSNFSEGGGIDMSFSVLTATDSTVSENTAAQFGGGIAMLGDASLTSTTIVNNTAIHHGGGGIWIYPSSSGSVATLTNSNVEHNTALQGDGGGILISSGGALQAGAATLTLNATSVSYNQQIVAGNGGGLANIALSGQTTTVIGNSLTLNGNFAGSDGGGLSNVTYGGTALVTLAPTPTGLSNVVDSNQALYGGGIYNQGSGVAGSLASIKLQPTTTISNNVAIGDGGGVYNSGGAYSATGTTFTSNIPDDCVGC
jgi:predicted outer membrane repeat protein